MTRILLLGLDPETVDFSDPALPPGMTVEKVRAAVVLFRIALNADSVRRYLCSLVKTYQSASNRSGKNRRKP